MGQLTQKEFDLLRHLIKTRVGITLHPRKRAVLGRKMAGRLQTAGHSSFLGYIRHLSRPEGEGELRALINQVTIDQTSFFRGDRQFELLRERVLPALFSRRREGGAIRLWSAGCSSGQEPYSVAMLFQEALRGMSPMDVKILATDVDSESLKSAWRASYSSEGVADVPGYYFSKYFFRESGPQGPRYRIVDRVREKVVFRRLNLKDTPYPLRGPMDVILCRNVMIYFKAPLKKKIMAEFYRLLADDGYLCLGGSESLLGVDDRFVLVGQAVYQKRTRP
ncbi:MAG: CheR family methyltransferase [Desulfatibacillaceae bacterium]